MNKFLQEFKAFAMKGNVIDLAVAVVVGGAFGKIVSSLVENIITPVLGVLLGGVNFSDLSFSVREADITYGIFLQNIFDFIIIALAIFIVIKFLANFKKKEKEEQKKSEPSEEIKLLREIRDNIRR